MLTLSATKPEGILNFGLTFVWTTMPKRSPRKSTQKNKGQSPDAKVFFKFEKPSLEQGFGGFEYCPDIDPRSSPKRIAINHSRI